MKVILFKLKISLILALVFSSLFSVQAQTSDSLKTRKLLINSIAPIAFITSGLIINNSEFEKQFQNDIRNSVGNDFHSSIDDYTQYIPIAELYIADMMGVKSRNHWFDQTKYLFISNFISALITHGLKSSVYKTRPDGSGNNSFPSGHTSFAFTNATVLFYEFQDSSPLLAYSGYAFSTTTATFRVLNNRHWVSDVLVGAGIGMLVTSLVYYFEPLKSFNPFLNSDKFTLVPVMDRGKYGAYFTYDF
ncbi:MAG: phosphatase PAP2 family protein [Flavobacteriales bacterium]|nr:phosphatase PAP2 family protein [Flavobacteriales bacterium]